MKVGKIFRVLTGGKFKNHFKALQEEKLPGLAGRKEKFVKEFLAWEKEDQKIKTGRGDDDTTVCITSSRAFISFRLYVFDNNHCHSLYKNMV